jgi:hypothetical protein
MSTTHFPPLEQHLLHAIAQQSKGMTSQASNNHDPLPLCELRERISLSTYQWIQEEEEKEKRALEEDEDRPYNHVNCFIQYKTTTMKKKSR